MVLDLAVCGSSLIVVCSFLGMSISGVVGITGSVGGGGGISVVSCCVMYSMGSVMSWVCNGMVSVVSVVSMKTMESVESMTMMSVVNMSRVGLVSVCVMGSGSIRMFSRGSSVGSMVGTTGMSIRAGIGVSNISGGSFV